MSILEPHDLAAVLQVGDGLTRLEDPVALAAGTRQKLGKELLAAKVVNFYTQVTGFTDGSVRVAELYYLNKALQYAYSP